jgi:CRP-like cAMP-binding protein
MITSFFRKLAPGRSQSAETAELHAQAAALLTAPEGPLQLTAEEAAVVVKYMHITHISRGTTFIKEGDAGTTGFLLLVIEGEVIVESIVVSRTEPVTVRVLGPGSMHGDVGLLDGLPRSASCTADSDLVGAVLTRDGLNRLMKRNPRVCCKFLVAIGCGIGARLRENTATLKRFVLLTRALEQELEERLRS